MDRERAKELLPIIEAYANGADIECRYANSELWRTEVPEFASGTEYRIKPEPREWWVYDDNINPEVIRSLNEIHRECHHRWIKVREVL